MASSFIRNITLVDLETFLVISDPAHDVVFRLSGHTSHPPPLRPPPRTTLHNETDAAEVICKTHPATCYPGIYNMQTIARTKQIAAEPTD